MIKSDLGTNVGWLLQAPSGAWAVIRLSEYPTAGVALISSLSTSSYIKMQHQPTSTPLEVDSCNSIPPYIHYKHI